MSPDIWLALATFAAGIGAGAIIRRAAPLPQPAAEIPQREPAPPADDRFDALVRALPLGVIMVSPDLRIRFANRAAGVIFGFDFSRAPGRHLIATVPSIELEQRTEAALRGERGGTPIIVSGKAVTRSYAVSVYTLSTGAGEHEQPPDGEVTGALIIAEDQTELLALERARQEFLTNVSHELRTPLSSIKLMLETVSEAGDEEARGMFLPQVLGQVDRLAALVQRLLEQARAQSGEMVLEISEVDLEQVARPIIGAFQPQAASGGVNLELRSLRPAIILADGQRLAQIFVNLIDNALRYTPEGGSVTVTIDVENGYAVIRVTDTGIGIPFKDQPYVFERFYVVDRSRARSQGASGGAGLGLAIVQQIAQAHGGSVDVSSTLGRGATFIVRLPVVSGQA